MPAPNQPEPSGFHLPMTITWMAALTHIVPALFESWARPAHEYHTNTDRTEARKAAINTLTDAAQKLDGANAALAVAVEEIDRLAHEAHGHPLAEEHAAAAIARIQAAAKGDQA